jgi:hypothetical protein
MIFTNFFLPSALLAATVMAGPLSRRDNDDNGLNRICRGLNTMENGCVRCKISSVSGSGVLYS